MSGLSSQDLSPPHVAAAHRTPSRRVGSPPGWSARKSRERVRAAASRSAVIGPRTPNSRETAGRRGGAPPYVSTSAPPEIIRERRITARVRRAVASSRDAEARAGPNAREGYSSTFIPISATTYARRCSIGRFVAKRPSPRVEAPYARVVILAPNGWRRTAAHTPAAAAAGRIKLPTPGWVRGG